MARILITGAAGGIGTALAPLLREQGHELVLLDLRTPAAAVATDEVVLASATDQAAVDAAAAGADLLLHLAAFASDRPWPQIVETNVGSVLVALEAARRAAVRVTVLASSVHAVGHVPSDEAGDEVVAVRPDSYYGVGKAVGEALGSLYADHFGLRVVSARIMSFGARPPSLRALATWVSPGDLARLVLAALDAPVGHRIVWGVSANTRRTVSLEAGRALGYEPQDDAEPFAEELAAAAGHRSAADVPLPGSEPLGGADVADPARPLGEPW